ncbi:NADPH dehydrogenase NamA [Mesobacillus jeotgali]|uniref:NADPH dehydrogenase NamA n=1 Tax=Mesobacillus jeotgali TaxID=129985 RepID=UPI00177BDAAE|nr:NADPH dehydrogenase NamA [Mesobacillus jeotgali]UYZ20670.1 NADPH dehydrogenase NamA [Mesobacillus jeotgali]
MEKKLFSPYKIKDLTLKNRIVMAPMCMYSCEKEDGIVTDFHMTHYVSRAVGQVGLVILEATAVTPQGRISHQDLGIWSDEHVPGLTALTEQIKQSGAAAGIQLAHAGRKAALRDEIIAPSALAFDEKYKEPKAMTVEEIKETVEAFRLAAERSKRAGFDVIEIHAAHGYLINQFLSPLTNKRDDEYGGTAENRFRFLRAILEEVKTVWDGPLFVRVSASDYHEEGLTVDDYVTIGASLKELGVDLIDVSSGAVVPARIHAYPGYQVKFAEKIKHEADIATGAVGLITTGIQAEEILQNDRAELIFIARELLRDPYWPRTAAKELGTSIESPKQYERGWIF